jgi:hypothetical protein
MSAHQCGHPLTPENTLRRGDTGGVRCRACTTERQREWQRRKRGKRDMYKVERLRAAGVIAPLVRAQRHTHRKVRVVSSDGSVRVTNLTEVQARIARRAGIEFDVAKVERPASTQCALCGRKMQVRASGRVALVCGRCPCVRCGEPERESDSRRALARKLVKRGQSVLTCKACLQRDRVGANHPRATVSEECARGIKAAVRDHGLKPRSRELGDLYRRVAAQYGATLVVVKLIAAGKSWRSL